LQVVDVLLPLLGQGYLASSAWQSGRWQLLHCTLSYAVA
jgi:hypothetical protein